MVVDIGFEWETGKVLLYDSASKNTTEILTIKGNKNNIDEVFNDFKTKNNKAICCICILLANGYGNEFRKNILQKATKIGFIKIEIIDYITAKFLSAFLQINFKPKNNEVIWKIDGNECGVWHVLNGKLIYDADLSDEYSNGKYKIYIQKNRYEVLPNLILYDEKFDKEIINQILDKTKIFLYQNAESVNGALIKARMLANDSDLPIINVCSLLNRLLQVKNETNSVALINGKIAIPFKTSIFLQKKDVKTLKIIEEEIYLELTVPEFESYFLIINFDYNGIFDIKFDDVSMHHEIDFERYTKNVYQTDQKEYFLPKSQHHTAIVGIEMGNSKCCAAVWRKNGVEIIPLDNLGKKLLPSYVAYDEEYTKFGQIVIDRLRHFSKSTVFDVKTFIGKSYSEIAIDENWPFKIIKIDETDKFLNILQEKTATNVLVELEGKAGKIVKKPEEIYADFLRYIKVSAERFPGIPLIDVVIAVPDNFSQNQRNAIYRAASIAGWKNIDLIPESVATICNFYFSKFALPQKSPLLLFDFGYSNIYINIFEIDDNKLRILNTSVYKYGSKSFDLLLINYFENKLKQLFDVTVPKEKKWRLKFLSETIKHGLSITEQKWLNVEDFDPSSNEVIEITKAEFELMSDGLIKGIQNFIESSLNDAKINTKEIKGVFQCGGGVRMPMIKNLLKNIFPAAKHFCENSYPDEVIALGAIQYFGNIKPSPPNNPRKFKISTVAINGVLDVVGVDLGTTRCCVAVERKNGVETVAIENTGERLMPSYVSYDEKHEKCGKVVVSRLRNFSKSTAYDSKRIIGKSFEAVIFDTNWPFTVLPLNNMVKILLNDYEGATLKYPEEISGTLLKYMKEKAEAFQGKELDEVVITIPAGFTDRQKRSTYVAALYAGWKEVHFILEPIAAALGYFADNIKIKQRPSLFSNIGSILANFLFLSSTEATNKTLLFDLGGGTLDVCIFETANNEINILGMYGNLYLGGKNFDKVLINYFTKKLHDDFGIIVTPNRKYKMEAKCQDIKENLSLSFEGNSLMVDDYDIEKDGYISITNQKFESLSKELLQRTKEVVLIALSNAACSTYQIQEVILVGGGCRMPMIKKLLLNIFPTAKHCRITHPDEIVAIGAVHYANQLKNL